jgi:hypothetical protein
VAGLVQRDQPALRVADHHPRPHPAQLDLVPRLLDVRRVIVALSSCTAKIAASFSRFARSAPE